MEMPDLKRYEGEVGSDAIERLRDVMTDPGIVPKEYATILCDDALFRHPSLIIRGMEFKRGDLYGHVDPNAMLAHCASEDLFFSALGRERNEINTPIIVIDDGVKISKRSNMLMHWECLIPMGREIARRFLISTAMKPFDPISNMSVEFSTSEMSEDSYEWNWEDHAECIKMRGVSR